ncbi:hypothetical protein [Leuconostoc citreum]
MTGLEYNIIKEWGRKVYRKETDDKLLEHVPVRVQNLWEDFHIAHQLPLDEQILAFDRILTDFQSHGWSK